jgi:outer membrane protein assembly factor BamB
MIRPASRRAWLAGCAASAVLWSRQMRAFAQATPLPAPADWPIFRGDAALRGVSGSALPESLRLGWSFEAESEPTSPVVARGRVIFGTKDGDLISLDLVTGKPAWRIRVEAGFEGAPTCASGLVLIGDLQGAVHALDFADGKKVWSHQTAQEAEIKASVAVASGSAIVGSYDGTLHALSLSDGARRWVHQSDAQIHATCAIHEGLAYVAGCDGHLRGLDAVTGAVKVDVRFGGYTAASPAMAGDLAVFGTMSNDVVAIDVARKEVAWRYTPRKLFPFYSSAAVSDGLAFVGSRDKALHALNLENGKLEWTFDTQGKIDS